MNHGNGHFPISDTKIAGFRYTKVKRLLQGVLHDLVYTIPSTAVHCLYLLGSSCISVEVLTSFIPPIHNQGVRLAPQQGLALWNIFLPTTGSFFVIHLTGLIGNVSHSGTFMDGLPVLTSFAFSFSCYS